MRSQRNALVAGLPTGVGAFLALALTGGLLVSPAQAAEDEVKSDQAVASVPDWTEVDESVTTAPSELAADVDHNDKARVVTVKEDGGVPVFDVTTVKGNAQAQAVVAEVQAADGTIAVAVQEKQQLIASTSKSAAADARTNSTSDPLFGSQWALSTLGAESAWGVAAGTGQTVAVVDTGTSREADLAGSLLVGWDFVNGRADGRLDPNGHGTHVAGVIAAAANNGLGGAGLAPGAKVLPVRALNSAGSGYWSDVANGIVYAVNQGAGVINLSLGGHAGDASLQAAINYARSNGRVVVAAVGNDGSSAPTYPAAYPGVIGVAASDQVDGVAGFSNSGVAVDLTAPGVGILSTVPGGYASLSGTSMAAPHVSAAAALLRSAAVSRGLGSVDVEAALRATATDIGAPGIDSSSGAGRINPRTAMCSVGACAFGVKAKVTIKKKKLIVRLNRAGIQRVILQRKVGKKWKRVAIRSTTAAGTATFKIKNGSSYRVIVPATAGFAAATSKPVRGR